SPYPEEMNRQLTGIMADMHFAPTDKSKQNLLDENKPSDRIVVTGNTAIDALKTTVDDTYANPVLDEISDRRLVLVTAHRRENIGSNMEQMFRAIKRLVDKHSDIQVIYPVHLNPVVQQTANDILGDDDRIKLIEPLGAVDFHNFAAKSHLIMTDSGGVDRKSTRLNSSHVSISYAVFCLKKKTR